MDTSRVLPEISSVLQRARSNRFMLDQLLDNIPDDRWEHRADGDFWTARTHLQHLATIDTVTRGLLEEPGERGFALDETVLARRTIMVAEVAANAIEELRARMDESRQRLLEHLAAFDQDSLATPVVISTPGVYPPEQEISLRAYLAAWAEHDAEHAEAIRAAVTANIQPSAVSAAVRLRRNRDG